MANATVYDFRELVISS